MPIRISAVAAEICMAVRMAAALRLHRIRLMASLPFYGGISTAGSYPLTGKGNGYIEIGFTFQEAIAS